jgi:hypothetical protein
MHWHRVHQHLCRFWEAQEGARSDQPPIPLILAGWVFSGDSAKASRWAETVEWASRHGLSDVVLAVPEDGWHYSQ